MRNKAKTEDDDITLTVRMREGLRRRLKAEADKNNRSLGGECVQRLQASLPKPTKRRAMQAAE